MGYTRRRVRLLAPADRLCERRLRRGCICFLLFLHGVKGSHTPGFFVQRTDEAEDLLEFARTRRESCSVSFVVEHACSLHTCLG
jgi:hypothetical protein